MSVHGERMLAGYEGEPECRWPPIRIIDLDDPSNITTIWPPLNHVAEWPRQAS